MQNVRVSSIQVGIGLFCSILGAAILVVPHEFDFIQVQTTQTQLFLFGLLFLFVGIALLCITIYQPPRWFVMVVYVFSAGLIIFLAENYLKAGEWISALNYALLVLGLLLATGFSRPGNFQAQSRTSDGIKTDLFALLVGVSAFLSGLIILVIPTSLINIHGSSGYLEMVWLPLGFVTFGLLLCIVQIPAVQRKLLPLHFGMFIWYAPFYLVAIAFWAFLIRTALPHQIWINAAFYGCFGLILCLIPVTDFYLPRFDPSSLHARLALILTVVMAIPLIVTVGLITEQEEESVKADNFTSQQSQAISLAQTIAYYIQLHQAALSTLTGLPKLMDLPAGGQALLLQDFAKTYPDVSAFTLYDASGNPIASTNLQVMGKSIVGSPDYENPQHTKRPWMDILFSPVLGRPIFESVEPILNAQGKFIGLAAIDLTSRTITEFLNQQNQRIPADILLVDEKGRAIAHPDPSIVENFFDLSEDPGVSAFLKRKQSSGVLEYRARSSDELSSFAEVPGLGWGVIVERSTSDALAQVYYQRDLAFGFLLLFLLIAILTGIVLAGRLVAPIQSLAYAVDEMASGNNTVPLLKSGFPELDGLALAFHQMRDHLFQRTAEREEYQKKLIETNLALQGTVKALSTAQVELGRKNEELETRVAERTAALRDANQKLEAVVFELENAKRDLEYELAELERAEEHIKTYAIELERSNKELEDFAFIASHDLQEPLRKIQRFGDLLIKSYKPLLGNIGSDYIERMQNAANRMQKMIEDLLAYSRISTRARPHQVVDLNKIVKEVISNLEARIHETGGRVDVNNLPAVKADPMQMHQLLQNLIGNALKFHQPQLTPVVEVGSRSISEEQLEIYVADNGIGFDDKDAELIFQPFQRLQGMSEYEGNGIGLAICRKIVETHGGTITATSTPGQGSTFFFTLPLYHENETNK